MNNSRLNLKYLFSCFIVFIIFTLLTIGIYDGGKQVGKHGINGDSGNFLINIDNAVENFSHNFHYSILNYFMKFVSDYGREYFWTLVLILLFLLGGHDGKVIAIVAAISILIVIPTNIIIKDLVNRDRPAPPFGNFYSEPKSDKSFPSGHASVVSAGVMVTSLFLRKSLKQKLLSYFLIVEAGLVCFSRLYLGVHYPFDIIGGILLGSGISLLVSSNANIIEGILNNLRFRHKNNNNKI